MKSIQIANNEIFEFHSDDHVCQSTFNEIINSNLSYVDNGPVNKMGKNYSTNGYRDLGNNKITFFYHKPLHDWIDECLHLVSKKYFEFGTLEISDSWVVKTTFGQMGNKHNHSLSMFSGLYYVTTHEGSETTFEIEDPFYQNFVNYYGDVIKKTNYIYNSVPKAGKLLIWPSYINHYLNIHKERDTRYTVAFNTELTGLINPKRTSYCYRKPINISESNSLPINNLVYRRS